jgi:DNA-binding CsgD family transcriptional regulator
MNAIQLNQYELQRVMDVAALARDVKTPEEMSILANAKSRLIPHEFAGFGSFIGSTSDQVEVSYTTYHPELNQLFVADGYRYDPSVYLMLSTKKAWVCSVDQPFESPRLVQEVKWDLGVKTCMSVGIRGDKGRCTYLAFSNFDLENQAKLRMIMDLLGSHLHLAYLRCVGAGKHLPLKVIDLTKKEAEVVKWLCEGKTNWEISIILHMSERTVRFHLDNLYRKLGVQSRFSVVARYQWSEAGLLPRESVLHC